MKTLTLLRHAKSGWDDGIARDFDRTLTPLGRRAAVAIGRHCRELGLAWDHVVASPAVRVTETLAGAAEGYGAAIDPAWDSRVYLASATTLLEIARETPANAARLLVVGHNPGLEDLALWLVAAGDPDLRGALDEKYPTGTLTELVFEVDDWAGLTPATATLARFVRPRDLDPAFAPGGD